MAAKIATLLFAVAGTALAEPGYGLYRPAVYGLGYYGLGGGVGVHPTGTSYTQRSPQGLGKRSAEPGLLLGYGPVAYGYGLGGVALHPDGTSYTQRSVQGLGKRSADAEPEADAGIYGYYGYGYANPGAYNVQVTAADPYNGAAYNYGVSALGKRSAEPGLYGLYPSAGASYVAESRPLYAYGYGVNHLGKRSAEPGYYGLYTPGLALHPYGSSYTYRSVQGLTGYHKRSAEPGLLGYYAPGASSYTAVNRPFSAYGVSVAHPY